MVVICSLDITVLEKTLKIINTVFDYFDPENFIFRILVTI